MSSSLVAGLDLGGSKLLAVAVDLGSDRPQVAARVQLSTVPGAAGVLDTAARALGRLTQQLDGASFEAIGIGTPGIVDPVAGTVTHAVNLALDGVGLHLAERLAERAGRPVVVENDVNAAAVGAARRLGVDDLAYLGIGTGIAAGLVLDGRLRRGGRNAAGEVGHLPLDPAGPVCNCGQRGCFEVLASGSAIAARWPSARDAPARALFTAAAAGNRAAVAVRDDVARHLAAGVRLLALSVDVDRIVLGGGVAEVGEPLRAAVAAALHRQAEASPFLRGLDLASRIVVLPFTEPVAAIGAALLAGGRRSPSTV